MRRLLSCTWQQVTLTCKLLPLSLLLLLCGCSTEDMSKPITMADVADIFNPDSANDPMKEYNELVKSVDNLKLSIADQHVIIAEQNQALQQAKEDLAAGTRDLENKAIEHAADGTNMLEGFGATVLQTGHFALKGITLGKYDSASESITREILKGYPGAQNYMAAHEVELQPLHDKMTNAAKTLATSQDTLATLEEQLATAQQDLKAKKEELGIDYTQERAEQAVAAATQKTEKAEVSNSISPTVVIIIVAVIALLLVLILLARRQPQPPALSSPSQPSQPTQFMNL